VNAQTWIEVLGLLLGGGGGGTAVAKLTRLVVAVEKLAEEVKQDRVRTEKLADRQQDHEIRLTKGGL
jgi:hypothetical protein